MNGPSAEAAALAAEVAALRRRVAALEAALAARPRVAAPPDACAGRASDGFAPFDADLRHTWASEALAAMLEHAHVFVRDMEGRITFWNQGAQRLYGWTAEEALGRVSHDLLCTIFPTSSEAVHAELLAAGRWEGELVHHRRDGDAVTVASLKVLLRDAAGAPSHVLEVNNDVTAVKRAEGERHAAYREAQAHAARLESLLAHAPLGIALLDAEKRYQHINPTLASLNGIPREEHLGRTIAEVLPTLAPLLDPIYDQVFTSGEPLTAVELVGQSASHPGDAHTWLTSFFPVHAADGAMLGAGVVMLDISQQRRLEKTLYTEQQRLRTIIETLDEGIVALDMDGQIVLLNSAAIDHIGVGPARPANLAELEQAMPYQMFDSAGRAVSPEHVLTERLLAGEEYRDVEIALGAPGSHQKRWFAMAGALARDVDGQVSLAVVRAREITAQKQAALALHESRQNLRELIDSTDGAIWSVDLDLRLVVGNATFRRLASELFGRELQPGEHVISELLPADVMSAMRGFYERGFAGEHFSATMPIPIAGAQRMFEHRVSPMRTAAGTVLGATVFARDITDLLQAERQLRDTERKLGTLFELLPVGISILDADGALAYANPAMERILRLDRGGLIDRAFVRRPHVRLDGTPLPPSEFAGARALREQQPVMDVEAGFISESGERVWISSSALPVQFSDWRLVVVMTDITVRVQADAAVRESAAKLSRTNAELTRALQLKDEFLAMMSHELRTPLNAVLGVTEALGDQIYGPLNDRQRAALDQVEQSGRHLLDLLSDILDLTRLGVGAERLALARVDVDALCHAALQQVGERAKRRQIRLVRAVEFGIDGLVADARRLTQILVNLLDNAVKFTPEGGSVGLEVTADAAQEQIAFTVWDTGIGIAPEDVSRLFQPFTQLDSRLSRSYEGIGIGLTLVRQLTMIHGGSVTLESAPGEGSRFTVRLPWPAEANRRPVERQAPPPLPAWPRPPRVVLVDDDEATLDLYGAYLSSHGFSVVVARTGPEALAQIASYRPDAAVLDIQLPELDGLAVLGRLRASAATAGIPIIAVTALAMPGDRERCLAAGATRYLAKPISARTLAHALAELVEAAGGPRG